MADNVTSAVSIPAYLQGISLGFNAPGLLADRLSPRIPVAFQSAIYRVWGRDIFLEREATWAPGTIPNAITMGMSKDTYLAEGRKLRTPLLDSELNNNASTQLGGVDLRGRRTRLVTTAIQTAREKRIANLFQTAANYPGANVLTLAGGSEWNTAGNGGAKVLTDISSMVSKVAKNAMVSKKAVTVGIPQTTWDESVMYNSAILDSVKYSQLGVVSEQLLATLLGVKEVVILLSMSVGAGPANAGSDIVTGYTPAYLWGDTVWVGIIGDGDPSEDLPVFSRSFNWTADTGGQERQIREYRMADEGQEGNWIECKESIDEKVVFSSAGAIIVNTSSNV